MTDTASPAHPGLFDRARAEHGPVRHHAEGDRADLAASHEAGSDLA